MTGPSAEANLLSNKPPLTTLPVAIVGGLPPRAVESVERLFFPGQAIANHGTGSGRYPAAGEVWLVGAGPGDPGLITVKGREALAAADVIVHDRLGCEEVLEELEGHALRIDVGKAPGRPGLSQDQINEVLLKEARAGNCVVRLKGGDPFVFGRGLEEVAFLQGHGVPCRVVPGVSSAFAGPASAGIAVTHRGVARSVTIATGTTHDQAEPIPSGPADTRIYMMGMNILEELIAGLVNEGLAKDTPAAVISWATGYRERRVRGTLASVAAQSREAGLEAPGLLIVGATVALAQETLTENPEQTILVTSGRIPTLLAESHPRARFVCRPLVRFGRLEDEARLGARRKVADAVSGGWIVFNSRVAVTEFFRLLRESGLDARGLRARLAAVGPESAAALDSFALVADFVTASGRRDALAAQLAAVTAPERVFFACAQDYRGGLAAELEKRLGGRSIELVEVYRAIARRPAPVDWRFIDAVCFASPVAVERFAAAWNDAPVDRLQAMCIGGSVRAAAQRAGFTRIDDVTGTAGADMPETTEQELESTA